MRRIQESISIDRMSVPWAIETNSKNQGTRVNTNGLLDPYKALVAQLRKRGSGSAHVDGGENHHVGKGSAA